jgi:hypothetical protein
MDMIQQSIDIENLNVLLKVRINDLIYAIKTKIPKDAEGIISIYEENNNFVGEIEINSTTFKFDLREDNSSLDSLLDLMESTWSEKILKLKQEQRS